MKTTKFYKRTITIGLIILSLLLNRFIPLPDFALGLLTGVGLGIEIYAIMMLSKRNKTSY
nr:hypothetical protein [Pseudopedobacter sp.]